MNLTRVVVSVKSGIETDDLGSHKITRAILYAMKVLLGDEAIEQTKKEPFVTTDLLPWSYQTTGSNKKTFFLPMPKIQFNVADKMIKKVKKTQYISETAFRELMKDINNEIDFSKYDIREHMLFRKEEDTALKILRTKRPHNSIYRIDKVEEEGGKINIVHTQHFFYSEALVFRNGGLYFDFYATTEETKKRVIAAVRLLEDYGIGKNISKGAGQIKIEEITDIKIEDLSKSNTAILLSSWKPTEEELEKIVPVSYAIKKFQPILRSKEAPPRPLQSIKLVSSGSVLLNAANNIIGEFIDIGIDGLPNILWGKALLINGPPASKPKTKR